MEANKILSSDILDIVFDGRNKSYGAYELRKTYNKRLVTALVVVASLFLLIFLTWFVVTHLIPHDEKVAMVVQDVQLEQVKPEEKREEPPPPPPPPKAEPPKVEMAKFTPPKIVKDEEVKEDEKPPEQDKLADVKIALTNAEGAKDEGVVAPPANDAGKGVISAPTKSEENWDQVFTKVEIESEYPGGQPAWARYLNKTFKYPQEAVDNQIEGTVVVKFIVGKDGSVSEAEVVDASSIKEASLRAEAIRVIKKSGSWRPAIQNGHFVRSYKQQPIIFKLEGN